MTRRSWWIGALLSWLALGPLGCGSRRGGGGGDDDDDSVSNDDRQALQGFLDGYPAAFCAWAVDCGYIEAAGEQECIRGVTDGVAETPQCDASVEFYVAHRAELDACLTGEGGACGENDDDFCPALAAFDYEHACDTPECTGPEQCNDGEDCVDGTCTVTGGGDLTTAQAVVGAWGGGGSCNGGSVEIGWFLCPAGRLRGFTTVEGYDFLDCGSYSVSGNDVDGTNSSTAVIDGSVDSYDFHMRYEASSDTLYWGSCSVPLSRLPGAVDEADCTGGTCSAGGSGDVDCGTDCDCGRCWYCESGTCRYGGEGAYGCYRGCGF